MKARLAPLAFGISVLLTLTACNSSSSREVASRERAEAARQEERPVFGYGGEDTPAAAGLPEQRTAEPRKPRRQARTEPQQRSRPILSDRSHAADERRSRAGVATVGDPGVGDPGESGVGRDVARAAARAESRRFLHYRPAGSAVVDPGELSPQDQNGSPELDGIRALIRKWADTLTARKLDAHLALYAMRLTSFYGTTDASRENVREWKKRLFAEQAELRQFEIYRLQLRRTTDGVVHARFRVRTDVPDLAGEYRMELRPDGSGWNISAEQRVESPQS